jgi:hypothetical protein
MAEFRKVERVVLTLELDDVQDSDPLQCAPTVTFLTADQFSAANVAEMENLSTTRVILQLLPF